MLARGLLWADKTEIAALLESAVDIALFSSILQAKGELDDARALAERAVRINEAAYGPVSSEVATEVRTLSSIVGAQADAEGARVLIERAVWLT